MNREEIQKKYGFLPKFSYLPKIVILPKYSSGQKLHVFRIATNSIIPHYCVVHDNEHQAILQKNAILFMTALFL